MLGKLMKYEFKATGRLLIPLYIALMIFAFINRLFIGDMMTSGADRQARNFISMITMIIYAAIMISIFVVTLFIIVQRYRTNLLGDEGYLMNTLPVKPWQNIMSKLLVSLIWMILSGIMAMLSIIILAYEKGMFSTFGSVVSSCFESVYGYVGINSVFFSLEIILIMILGLISSILIIYASLSIGNLFAKSKILASFGAFIVLSTVSKVITAFACTIMINNFNGAMRYDFTVVPIHILLIVSIVGMSIFPIVYFIISHYVLTKKLNLE